jgi:hypothetical protein
VVGPGLPVPLSGGVALDALRRVTGGLTTAAATWRTGTGRRLPAFRALQVDTTDLAVLGMAAAQLTPPRPAEGALGAALDAVARGGGEPPDDRHPAALGCLLAVLVPVIDPAVVTLHGFAVRGGDATLSEAGVGAHREVVCRVLARLRRAR